MITIFFIFGLIIGSFINAVVYRLEAVESLMERSHCPHCRKKIRWFDNIPLFSFVLLSARCRDCGEKISWLYPAVEVTTGFVFAILGNAFFSPFEIGSWLSTGFYLVIFSLLMVIFVYDLKYMEIPMLVVWLGVGVTLAYFLFLDWQNFHLASSLFELKTTAGLIGGVVAFAFFFALSAYSKETWMGYGDAYIGFLAGLIVGWPNILWTLTLSFAIGALISVGFVAFRRKTLKSQVPFAPFLITGVFLMVVLPQVFPVLQYFLVF